MSQNSRKNYACATAYGPLGDLALRFIAQLRAQNYERGTLWHYQSCLAQLGRRMAQEDIGLGDLDAACALELIATTEAFETRKINAAFIVKRFVGWLTEQGLAKPPPAPAPKDVTRAALRSNTRRTCASSEA